MRLVGRGLFCGNPKYELPGDEYWIVVVRASYNPPFAKARRMGHPSLRGKVKRMTDHSTRLRGRCDEFV
jgi:hypothetical protein